MPTTPESYIPAAVQWAKDNQLPTSPENISRIVNGFMRTGQPSLDQTANLDLRGEYEYGQALLNDPSLLQDLGGAASTAQVDIGARQTPTIAVAPPGNDASISQVVQESVSKTPVRASLPPTHLHTPVSQQTSNRDAGLPNQNSIAQDLPGQASVAVNETEPADIDEIELAKDVSDATGLSTEEVLTIGATGGIAAAWAAGLYDRYVRGDIEILGRRSPAQDFRNLDELAVPEPVRKAPFDPIAFGRASRNVADAGSPTPKPAPVDDGSRPISTEEVIGGRKRAKRFENLLVWEMDGPQNINGHEMRVFGTTELGSDGKVTMYALDEAGDLRPIQQSKLGDVVGSNKINMESNIKLLRALKSLF